MHHPVLNKAEFFGGLRSLSSLSGGALVLVIASRQSLTALNAETQQYNRTGSPFFNIFDEITLGAFSKAATDEILNLAGDRFTPDDRDYINHLAGGHPYLLQTTASALWEAYEDGEEDAQKRYRITGEVLFDQAALTISDTWRLWSPEMKKAFATIALDEIPALLGKREFDVDSLVVSLSGYQPELRDLKKRGFIIEDVNLLGGWRVRPRIFTAWLTDELMHALRDKDELGKWLFEQEWGEFLKQSEKQQLVGMAQGISRFLKNGVTSFI
ncbi:MAG: hypothetical protein AB1649_27490, partial [Chloroflexota bacterium]